MESCHDLKAQKSESRNFSKDLEVGNCELFGDAMSSEIASQCLTSFLKFLRLNMLRDVMASFASFFFEGDGG